MHHLRSAPYSVVAFFFVVAALLFITAGCARLEYRKVPTPTQYSNWTDTQQREADAMEGVRYYLPRPFLHLKQSTPVAQRTALVSFKLQDDGYHLSLPTDAPAWLQRVAPKQISITQALALSLAFHEKGEGVETQSGVPDAVEEDSESRDPAPTRPPSELRSRTGFINDTDPVTRLSDRMDVVYLPDFEEQYVIRARAGFGTADIETRLRNGWAAEVFSQQVDNSNLIPYVIEQVETTSNAAAGIVRTWAPMAAGLPPGTSVEALVEAVEAQRGRPGAATSEFLADVLIFKIAEIKIAQPGLYPILKPREITHWLKPTGIISAGSSEKTLELALRNAQLPWIRPDMAFIPCPPFTMIGFNVTTDVFIAPATAQILGWADSQTNRGKNGADEDDAAVREQLKEKLRNARGDLDEAVRSKINWDKIGVASTPEATTITLPLNETIPDAERADFETNLKSWAEDALGKKPEAIRGGMPSIPAVNIDFKAAAAELLNQN